VSALVGLQAAFAFCLVHAWSARRLSWPWALLLAGAAVLTVLALVGQIVLSLVPAVALDRH
jgi:hypothetical protein